jgi:hypothetical protein
MANDLISYVDYATFTLIFLSLIPFFVLNSQESWTISAELLLRVSVFSELSRQVLFLILFL